MSTSAQPANFLPSNRARVFASTKGFLPVEEAAALREAAVAAPAGVWLEIGTYCGKSTIVLGDAAEATGATLITIDHHRGSEENQPGWQWHDESLVDPAAGRIDTLPFLRQTLVAAELSESVTVLVSSTQSAAQWWVSDLSFLFLDGNHTEEVAQHDYAQFARHLIPGGVLAVHDVFPDPADGGQPPWHVVQRALTEGFSQIGECGSLRVLRRNR